MALFLLALLLLVPGFLLRRGFGVAAATWGCGVLAVDASLSLGFLALVLLPLYLAEAPVALAAPAAFGAIALLAVVTALLRGKAGAAAAAEAGFDRIELLVFAAAVALLLPTTLSHSGANVDDWWDLSFVSGWIADGHFGFAQMALAPEAGSGPPPVHPRFLWSVWLVLQTLVSQVCGEAAWKIQGSALATASMVLVVSAQAALARAIRRLGVTAPLFPAASIAMATAWIWGSDALPLFARSYQDKLFAAFAMAPVLLAMVLDASRAAATTADASKPRGREVAAIALAGIALVSVHSLIFTMAVFVSVLALAAVHGRGILAWSRRNAAVLVALGAPALYPVGQAVALAVTFGEQGVSLATPDNPVVRAHLSLNRLLGASSWAWVVHPGAVFGSVALAAGIGLALAWRRRRDDAAARVLVAITVVPCLLLFVPGLAAAAGRVWVPWMLYRLGWMVPVASLLAYAFATLAESSAVAAKRPVAATAFVALVAGLAGTSALDRIGRGMQEHPGQPSGKPIGAAAEVLDFLALLPGREAVLAPPNFSELLPAASGKPVVAFPERGSLVFSRDEATAYRRLRDRAEFFAPATTPMRRDEVAARYGVRWAVLPRRQIASGSEDAWMRRFGPEAFLAAKAVDEDPSPSCRDGACAGWWSATREGAVSGFSSSWSLVVETRDYFVAERAGAVAASPPPPSPRDEHAPAAAEAWRKPFDLTAPMPLPAGHDLLASVSGLPASRVTFSIPPRYLAPSLLPVWSDGPLAWEDAPAEAAIAIDVGVACTLSAIEVLPHLPRSRRDVLEVAVDGRVVRAAARDGEPVVVALADAPPRSSISVRVSSLLGSPVSLADVRVLGDRASCEGTWPVYRQGVVPQVDSSTEALLDVASQVPGSGRPFVSIARLVAKSRGKKDAVRVLREATRREPSLVEAWIELGFAEDDIAAAETDASAAAAARTAALDAFAAAARADSHSAWAAGCDAWAERRARRTFAAIWNALVAAQLDPDYADAWTILGYALSDLHLRFLAARALDVAERIDPDRNWPALARADLAIAGGDVDGARKVLRAWILAHPFDDAVRSRMSEISGAAAAADGGAAAGGPR